jgi:ribosome-associated protein
MDQLNVGSRSINLTQVLKLANLAENGGAAKALIAEGHVRVNGEVELRKRRQMAVGDIITIEGLPPLVLTSGEESS